MSATLDARLAALILAGGEFTADDLTDGGRVTLDAAHAPNGRQNGIGAYVRYAAQRGRITATGRFVRSRSPHRKGGAVRVWSGTAAGRSWAAEVTS